MKMAWHPLPAEVYALVEQTPATVLLETSKPGAGAQSHLFTSALRVIEVSDSAELPALFAEIESETRNGHFAAGFFAYECGHFFEPTTAPSRRSAAHSRTQPLAWVGIYERSYRFDHSSGAFENGEPPGLERACENDLGKPHLESSQIEISSGITEQQHSECVRKIQEWIRAGDVYQLNFTFPLRLEIAGRPAALYANLRRRQPVEYGAFVQCNSGRHILCFSPELFFRIEDQGGSRRITAKPMKGTARRGRTTAEDRQVAEWLRNDVKNRSENVMIVDLIRNDLGRLCNYGSVHVESLFEVERFPTLWQMTSTVTGELRQDVGYQNIFRALFPCGSITGAPKVRAMQLLDQIEDEPRGIYCGAVGYFSSERTVFNVAIRTVDLVGGQATMGVGGGIVIDSDAQEEFRECQLKAEFVTRSEEPFSLIESMLWQGGYPFIEFHLDRLEDSAAYFGFPCEREAIKAALLAIAKAFADDGPRKVRLLLDPDGSLDIEQEAIPETAGKQFGETMRVRISADRTDPGDHFLFHKTTHRAVYARALQAAKEAGFADVLFLNMRGEVTEGAISNIFIAKDGRWFTPPVSCGLLAGIYRRHMLETRSGVEERVLYPEDLKTADAVYLTNAVRGLQRVSIDWQG